MPVPIQSEAHSRRVGLHSSPTSRKIARIVFYISDQAILSRRQQPSQLDASQVSASGSTQQYNTADSGPPSFR
jgi:hypothetical protein